MPANSGEDIENAFVDSGAMENAFRPAVAASRHDPKHVFYAQRDASPEVCFYFGHRDDEIRRKDGLWQPQVAETGIVGLEFRFDQAVAIEIYESDLAVRHLISESGLV